MKSTFGSVSSLLLGVAFLIGGNALQQVAVPLRATAAGWSHFQIGAIGSAYYFGFLLGCVGAPYAILRAGHIRAFAAVVSLAAAAIVAFPLWMSFPVWFALRMVLGASLASFYLIVESWLNDRASNTSRGVIMSAYIIVNYVAMTAGQLVVGLYSPAEFTLFALATLSISLATIPVALTRSAQPAPITMVSIRPRALYRASPVGVVGVAAVGLANGAFWSLGPVSVIGAGLTTRDAALFMSIATVGGALMQWPVGRLSDMIDRRAVLMGLLLAAAVAGVLLAFLPGSMTTWYALAFVFGMAALPTYSIAAAHAYDYAEVGSYVETASGILLANACGAIVGPLLASSLMQQAGAATLFLYTAIVQVALAAFVFSRLRRRRAPVAPEKTEFDLAATAPVGGVISPEPLNPDDASVATPPPAPDNNAQPPAEAA